MKKNLSKKISVLSLILVLTLLFTACSGGGEQPSSSANEQQSTETPSTTAEPQTQTAADILYIGMTNAPDSFNVINTAGIAGRWIQRFLFDTLLTMPTTKEFGPALADSFESEDNQNFTIKLNKDAVWSDGVPITAEDVVFTINFVANPEVETSEGVNISMLEGVTESGKLEEGLTEVPDLVAVDEKTVVFKTKQPVDPSYIKEFLGFDLVIIPKHIVENIPASEFANSEFATKATITSGPYTMTKYENNSYVELTAYPDYYKGEAEIKKIFAKVMNGTNLITEFQSNGIQMAAGGGIGMVPVQDVGILRDDPNLQVDTYPGFSSQYMLINNTKYTNVKFRQALAYAINRQLIVDNLLRGEGEIIPGGYTSASPYYNNDVDPFPYDPEKAKQLLAESGFDTSKELNLIVPIGNKVREQSANLIEQDLEAIGLNVVQTTYDFPTVLATVKDPEKYDLCLIGFAYTVDPNVSTYYASTGAMNFSKINDAHLDELFAKGTQLTSFEDRKEVYDEVQEYMRDNVFIMGLYSDSQFAVKNKVLNGGIKAFWTGSLSDVHLWNLKGAQ